MFPSYARLLIAFIMAVFLVASSSAAEAPSMVIHVDARELPRRMIHTTLEISCRPGPLTLWYPKWFPGSHGPHGRVEDIGGLRIETPQGTSISWKRDDVDLHGFHLTVPDGASSVRVKLVTICESPALDAGAIYSFGNASLGVINWNTCLVYPGGIKADEQKVDVRLQLPNGWKFATALKWNEPKENVVTFQTTSLTSLIDNPLIAGRHLRSIPLVTGSTPAAFLDLVSESPEALKLEAKIIDKYSRLVREAGALFGVAHYPEYHFLVVCSDDLGRFGLEHLACSLNGMGERGLIEDRLRKGWLAMLIPHEYAHSWCGKYRRPSAMITPDFHTPQKTKHLWVYEGLTQYLGDVLMVRAGLATPEEYLATLTGHIGNLSHVSGRQWRSLEDTAVAGHLFRNPGSNWNDLRRNQDFYFEGMLLWFECDAIIRERSDGKKSLDDFCKRFFARVPGQATVAGYEYENVVRDLSATIDYDWDGFLRQRVTVPLETLPLDVVGRLGYRLRYTEKPTVIPGGGGASPAMDTLGIRFAGNQVVSLAPGLPADKAGIALGMKVIGVNGKKFSQTRLRDALADSTEKKKLEFLLEDGDDFRTIVVPYADGLRYLELTRVDGKPDVLADILKPQAK